MQHEQKKKYNYTELISLKKKAHTHTNEMLALLSKVQRKLLMQIVVENSH